MPRETITIRTADGECPTHMCTPNGTGPWPAAILYMEPGESDQLRSRWLNISQRPAMQ